jgi:hypothetical protein
MLVKTYDSTSEPSDELGIGSPAPKSTQQFTTHGPRSLSADQGHSGKVYFVLCKPSGCRGRIKIGWTSHPKLRMSAIQTGCPFPIQLLALVPGSRRQEKHLHEHFADLRFQGEWFDATDELLSFIESAKDTNRVPLTLPPASASLKATPIRQELANLIRAFVEPCIAGEKTGDQIKRAARCLGLNEGQVWRMWQGRGSPTFLPLMRERVR